MPIFSKPEEANHPAIIAERLMQLPEHEHLKDLDATIDWLMRNDEKIRGGRRVLGSVHLPGVRGELSDLFDDMLIGLLGRTPDFLIILETDYWNEATPLQREILVYHELSHCQQKVDRYGAPRVNSDGSPVWGLRGHDVEEFTQVVRRYGAHNTEIQEFINAANSYGNF